MSERRHYPANLIFNGRQINEIIIDPYYKEKHPDINDQIILDLVSLLNGREIPAEDREDDFEYFMVDRVEHPKLPEMQFRLVWCMQDSALFLGVVNCFRR